MAHPAKDHPAPQCQDSCSTAPGIVPDQSFDYRSPALQGDPALGPAGNDKIMKHPQPHTYHRLNKQSCVKNVILLVLLHTVSHA